MAKNPDMRRQAIDILNVLNPKPTVTAKPSPSLNTASFFTTNSAKTANNSDQRELNEKLFAAIDSFDASAIKALLTQGADANAINHASPWTLTPLGAVICSNMNFQIKCAVSKFQEVRDIINVLLEAKANPNLAATGGQSAYYWLENIKNSLCVTAKQQQEVASFYQEIRMLFDESMAQSLSCFS